MLLNNSIRVTSIFTVNKSFSTCIILLFLVFPVFAQSTEEEPEINTKTFSVIGVGDIMLGTDFPNRSYLPPNNDCMPLLEPAKDILLSADITFGNLEGAFLNKGEVAKRCSDSTRCYAFKMPEHFINCLVETGFDVVSLANNHVGDFGDKGRKSTMRLLDSVGIAYAGLLTHPTSIFERSGLKIGFAAFAPNKGTCNINDIITAKRIVTDLKKNCDILIVSFHGGAEGANHTRVTRETEYFYGEDRGNVYEFARHVIDAGADVVFGHGPHVTRAIDLYKGRFIAYSLGNFCTYGRFNLRGPNGIAPIVKIEVNSSGEFLKGQIFSFVQEGRGEVKLDNDNKAVNEIQKLLASDFPESPIIVTIDGGIQLKE